MASAWGDSWASAWGDSWGALNALPVQVDDLPNISEVANTGAYSYELGDNFIGGSEYAISPALETGWSLDDETGEFAIDTDGIGVFGPYTLTVTNAFGEIDSNTFTVSITALAYLPPMDRTLRVDMRSRVSN
jgi:hypothetical protein